MESNLRFRILGKADWGQGFYCCCLCCAFPANENMDFRIQSCLDCSCANSGLHRPAQRSFPFLGNLEDYVWKEEASDVQQSSIFSLPFSKNLLEKKVSLKNTFLHKNEKLKAGLLPSTSFRSALASLSHHGKVRSYKHIIKPRAVTKKSWTGFPPGLRYCKFFPSSGPDRVPKVSVLLQPDASFSRFI